jgi:D-serine deaminase-like pyridoxal phosphate-dependent protein
MSRGAEAAIGEPVAAIDTPALLEAKLAAMRACAAGRGVACRPHTQSHELPAIAALPLRAGAAGVCCAKPGEAAVMVAGGGSADVLVTTPVAGARKAQRHRSRTRFRFSRAS